MSNSIMGSTFPLSGSAGADTSSILDSDSLISIGDDGRDIFSVHFGF
jgi:hypothetical protein